MAFHEIEVLYDNGHHARSVGRLASSGQTTIFEYDESWRQCGLELSPFMLPIASRSHTLKPQSTISGTFGLFADSLPDGWGLLIMDRHFKRRGIARHLISPIDRLAFLGDYAMGALCYHPPALAVESDLTLSITVGEIAREAWELYEGRLEDAGRLLTLIGGSPGGARPKALIGISAHQETFITGTGTLPEGFAHWLVKFSGKNNKYEGLFEFVYHQMAKAAGITLPECLLITDDEGISHMTTRRFDRVHNDKRRHVATACGLLHADHMAPTMDYEELMKLAWRLTGSAAQVEEQFRRAAFNLYANNRDDHTKNHGYIMSDDGRWELSPAYDLTFSTGPGGEHWTSYSGEGRNPGRQHILTVAASGSLRKKDAHEIVDQVKAAVSNFRQLAKEAGLPDKEISPVANRLDALLKETA